LCLTNVLNIIYDDSKPELQIKAILLVCIPNGLLSVLYGDEIIGAGKTKDKSIRYEYHKSPYFKLIEGKSSRIKILYKSVEINIKNIINFDLE